MDSSIMWQLIDTSVKVGIGILIATMFAVMLFHRRQPKPIKAEERRLALMESISADVGNVSHTFSKYSALVVESLRYGQRWPVVR